MEKILLINPIGSRRKNRAPVKSRRKSATAKRSAANMAKRKARRTAAQKAATRRLVALNRSRRKAPAAKRRRRNPLGSKAAAYRAVPTIAKNPVRRRRRAAGAVAATRRRRVRRNPLGRGIVNQLVMPAVTATAGALVLDLAWGYLPLPAAVKAGPMRHLAKAAGAVALSVVGSKVVKKSTADAMGLGALTVVLHEAAKEALVKFVPGVKLDGVGMYVNGLGYYSPAMPAGGDYQTGGALPSPGESLAGVGMYVNGMIGNGLETEAGYSYP